MRHTRRSRITELAVLAGVVAAVVSLSVLGLSSHQTTPTHPRVVDTLSQPIPPADDQPAEAVTVVASVVLPSAVELSRSDGAGIRQFGTLEVGLFAFAGAEAAITCSAISTATTTTSPHPVRPSTADRPGKLPRRRVSTTRSTSVKARA